MGKSLPPVCLFSKKKKKNVAKIYWNNTEEELPNFHVKNNNVLRVKKNLARGNTLPPPSKRVKWTVPNSKTLST